MSDGVVVFREERESRNFFFPEVNKDGEMRCFRKQ